MNFERGKDVKEALSIGIPTYSIYKMREFKNLHNPGFYFLVPKKIRETLTKLSMGKLARQRHNYIIEFDIQYPELKNKFLKNRLEIRLCEMPSCFLKYQGKKYSIKSHIV